MYFFHLFHIIDLKIIQYQKAKIEWNNKAWLHTHYIYIITILTIIVGPTKVDLNIHDSRYGLIYCHLTLLIGCLLTPLWNSGAKIADDLLSLPA